MIFSKLSLAFAIVGIVLVHSEDVEIPDEFRGTDEYGITFDKRTHCASDCTLDMKGNWRCDKACQNEACGWDEKGCRSTCACRNCEWYKLGNGVCDPECDFDEGDCKNDGGDCKVQTIDQIDYAVNCAKNCPWNVLGNGKCDLGCHKEKCEYDFGDCGPVDVECAPNCIRRQINNDVCEPECNVRGCKWDYDDCGDDFAEVCSGICVKALLGNKNCDPECLSEECGFDKGDCDCTPGCSILYKDDGICQPECANRDCRFDDYDCECAPGCTKELLENDTYDSVCLYATCDLEYETLTNIADRHYTEDGNRIIELPNNVKITIYQDGTVVQGHVSGRLLGEGIF